MQTFFDNPVIQKLSGNPRWTVNIDGKLPLDIQALKKSGRILGALGEHCLTTLTDLLDMTVKEQFLPEQFVYLLDAERDGIAILDIEPECPEAVRKELLNLEFLYGDISASGRGYHLAFICPVLDEVTGTKKAMKHPLKYYEILLNHYVTFTQNLIFPVSEPSKNTFQEIWDYLAKQQKIAVENAVNVSEKPKFRNKMHKRLYDETVRAFQSRFTKTPSDYGGDVSRYEFGAIGAVRSYLKQLSSLSLFSGLEMDENDEIWTVYGVISEVLPHRSKHDEKRSGQPFLFYLVCKSFATVYKN